MTLKKRLLALLAAVGLAVGGVAMATTPAYANWSTCPNVNSSGTVIIGCLYLNVDGGGSPYLMGNVLGCHNLTGGWSNTTSAVLSQAWGNSLVVLWSGSNCSGEDIAASPGDHFNLPNGLYSVENDDAESWALYSGYDGEYGCFVHSD